MAITAAGNRGTGTAHTSKHTRACARILLAYNTIIWSKTKTTSTMRNQGKDEDTENRATTNNTHTNTRAHARTCTRYIYETLRVFQLTYAHTSAVRTIATKPSAVLIMHDIILYTHIIS